MEARVGPIQENGYSVYFYAYGRLEGKVTLPSYRAAVDYAIDRCGDVYVHEGWTPRGAREFCGDDPAKSLEGGGWCSPIRVTSKTAPRFVGLLMPMRA